MNVSKFKKMFTFVLVALLVVSGCLVISSFVHDKNNYSNSATILKYNNKLYQSRDNYGRNLNSYWFYEDKPSIKAKAYIGSEIKGDVKTNHSVKLYDNENLSMFLYDPWSDILYCEKDYQFPDYRYDSGIEKIYIKCNDQIKVIDQQIDVNILLDELIEASCADNNANKLSVADTLTTDNYCFIYIKYKNFDMIFSYGDIQKLKDNKYIMTSYDSKDMCSYWMLSDGFVDILKKYSAQEY